MSPIYVTKSYLPPLDEYVCYLQRIWETNQLTNNGALARELEEKLKNFLGVKHLFFVSNGTIALQIAIKALNMVGEIITTPFSYVATTSSIVWEGCKPVFVDIDPQTLCLDPNLVEKAITPRTTGILATHVYGYPCDVERIQAIADRYGLKVIYDAAHAFGVRYKGISLMNYGDISTLSFHATKLFHSGEGGAVVTSNDDVADRISYMRNFGHRGPEEFWGLGVNGKNSEFHAAMGLCVLPKVSELITTRKTICSSYDHDLDECGLLKPKPGEETEYNAAYYPVIFPSEESLLQTRTALNAENIFPRRYFYPALNKLPYLEYRTMPIAENIAQKVLCLPLYDDLQESAIRKISGIIRETLVQVEHKRL
jgi:dTDP-4-amino-4,6-dideoxygalactose transaminase